MVKRMGTVFEPLRRERIATDLGYGQSIRYTLVIVLGFGTRFARPAILAGRYGLHLLTAVAPACSEREAIRFEVWRDLQHCLDIHFSGSHQLHDGTVIHPAFCLDGALGGRRFGS